MGTWTNDDGLYVKYGTTEGEVTTGGQISTMNSVQVVEVKLTMTDLADAAAIMADNVVLPAGATILQVDTVTSVAVTSGGAAVLDVGIIDTDRSSNGDDDALIAALALASINAAGETNELVAGSTSVGAAVETILARDSLITASYDTAAFTAGEVVIRVHYMVA